MPFWGRGGGKEEEVKPAPRHLPLPTGPYAVGYQDVMTEGSPETGVFLRLYYPSIFPLAETLNQHQLWPVWADDDYLVGFVKFMQAMIARWPSWAPRGEYMFIDQMAYIAPVMHIGCKQVWKLLNGTVHCPILHNAPISRDRPWPVVVFSHGMGCTRFAYSRICTDLASHGFLVAATEHRDGSASLSFHLDVEKGKEPTPTWIHHQRLGEEKEYLFRNRQLKFRCEEIQRTLDLVLALQEGGPIQNLLPAVADLHMFKGQLDTSSPVVAGHSFGGASTLLALAEDARFKLGLVLDGWLFPLKEEALQPSQPIVFINTESFMNRQNISKMRDFLTDPEHRRMVFIKGSVHQNHIDAPFIFKSVTIKKIIGMHSATDPHTVLEVNNKLMIHFITSRLELETDAELTRFLEQHESVLIEASDILSDDDEDGDERRLTGKKSVVHLVPSPDEVKSETKQRTRRGQTSQLGSAGESPDPDK